VEYCKPSFGNFLATARTAYWFGIPRSVSFPGLMMDIQRYAVMNVAKDYNPASVISYNRQSGMRASAYEHLIPEKLFTDQTQPNAPQAISAVKALSLAAAQGQKIFTITQANQDIILPQINVDPDVMTEMQNALSAGKEVTVHQSPITQSGWIGTGYIITDPVTGAGAYKISGGANGTFLLFGLALGLVFGIAVIGGSALMAGILGAIAFSIGFINHFILDNQDNLAFNMGRLIGIVSGVVLATILGDFVLISFTPLFVFGIIVLISTVLEEIIIEFYMMLSLFIYSKRTELI
jgi:hypothetical protein